MKKATYFCLASLLILALLVGCGKAIATVTPTTEPVETTRATQPTEPVETTPVDDLPAAQVDPAYAQPIGNYYASLSKEALTNVGFGYADLDQDGQKELIIGTAEEMSVQEIWTIADGTPKLLAKSDAENRHGLQYVEEDMCWYVVKEVGGNGTYFLMLADGELGVTQGVIQTDTGWYMTYDLDGDVSNDDPTDEDTATAILEMNRKYYILVEYESYAAYRD